MMRAIAGKAIRGEHSKAVIGAYPEAVASGNLGTKFCLKTLHFCCRKDNLIGKTQGKAAGRGGG